MYLFLERCKKSDNVWLHALIQSDSVVYIHPYYYCTLQPRFVL